jgi:hypothetical protein
MSEERDSHFAGFARLLIPELDAQVGAVTTWAMEQGVDDEQKIAQELAARWRLLLARRAYDLVEHALKEAEERDLFADDLYGRFRLSTGAKISEIPDMGALPD